MTMRSVQAMREEIEARMRAAVAVDPFGPMLAELTGRALAVVDGAFAAARAEAEERVAERRERWRREDEEDAARWRPQLRAELAAIMARRPGAAA